MCLDGSIKVSSRNSRSSLINCQSFSNSKVTFLIRTGKWNLSTINGNNFILRNRLTTLEGVCSIYVSTCTDIFKGVRTCDNSTKSYKINLYSCTNNKLLTSNHNRLPYPGLQSIDTNFSTSCCAVLNGAAWSTRASCVLYRWSSQRMCSGAVNLFMT